MIEYCRPCLHSRFVFISLHEWVFIRKRLFFYTSWRVVQTKMSRKATRSDRKWRFFVTALKKLSFSPVHTRKGAFQNVPLSKPFSKASVFIGVFGCFRVGNRRKQEALVKCARLRSERCCSSPGREHCTVFLGKTLWSHSASLHPDV